MQWIEAEPVDQLGRALDIPDRKVAGFSGSMVPIVSSRPSARAASRVTPAMHSSTVSRNSVAAMFIVSSSDVIGEVPGLLSVAIAI